MKIEESKAFSLLKGTRRFWGPVNLEKDVFHISSSSLAKHQCMEYCRYKLENCMTRMC